MVFRVGAGIPSRVLCGNFPKPLRESAQFQAPAGEKERTNRDVRLGTTLAGCRAGKRVSSIQTHLQCYREVGFRRDA